MDEYLIIEDVKERLTFVSQVSERPTHECLIRRVTSLRHPLDQARIRQWGSCGELGRERHVQLRDVHGFVHGFVQDLKADLEMARKPPTQNLLRREYVLPDGLNHTRGYVKVGCRLRDSIRAEIEERHFGLCLFCSHRRGT